MTFRFRCRFRCRLIHYAVLALGIYLGDAVVVLAAFVHELEPKLMQLKVVANVSCLGRDIVWEGVTKRHIIGLHLIRLCSHTWVIAYPAYRLVAAACAISAAERVLGCGGRVEASVLTLLLCGARGAVLGRHINVAAKLAAVAHLLAVGGHRALAAVELTH